MSYRVSLSNMALWGGESVGVSVEANSVRDAALHFSEHYTNIVGDFDVYVKDGDEVHRVGVTARVTRTLAVVSIDQE